VKVWSSGVRRPHPWRSASWRRYGAALLLLGLIATATQLRSPLLLKVRLGASLAVLSGGLCLLALGARALRRERGRARASAALLCAGALVAVGIGVGKHAQFARQQQQVARAPAAVRARLGRHLVAGFRSWDEAARLVDEAQVGGVYVGLHNARGLSIDELAARIADLRRRRAARGLSPLLVAVDQEGGPVSRLSPPLPQKPALSSVLEGAAAPAAREQAVRALAREQARSLRQLGANINFSPVVDLRLHPEPSLWDRYSFIGARAISADPAVVADVARLYADELLAQGVVPTAKHFPGLGRVLTDTHFFPAILSTPLAELQASDWVPFRAVLQLSPTLLMVGHVRLTALDGEHLAGTSAALIDQVVRGGFGYQGVIITDDLCMTPAFYGPGGLPGFARAALQAGVDLILISYDGSQVYAALAALIKDMETDPAALAEPLARSDARLDRLDASLGRALAPK
jgi:beta-N-acetylhexosaminidase